MSGHVQHEECDNESNHGKQVAIAWKSPSKKHVSTTAALTAVQILDHVQVLRVEGQADQCQCLHSRPPRLNTWQWNESCWDNKLIIILTLNGCMALTSHALEPTVFHRHLRLQALDQTLTSRAITLRASCKANSTRRPIIKLLSCFDFESKLHRDTF